MSFTRVPDSDKPRVGDTYRVTYQIRAPYNAFTINTIKGALRAGNTINNVDDFIRLKQHVSIDDIETFPPLVSTHDGRNQPWDLRITYRVTALPANVNAAGIGEWLALFGAILLALSFLGVVVGHYSEKLVTVLEEAGDAAKKVLNPFAVIAVAALGIILVTARGK